MKAEAAECVRTALVLGLGSSDLAARGQLAFLEREACRWSAADEVMDALRRGGGTVAGRCSVRCQRLYIPRACRRPVRAVEGRAPLRLARGTEHIRHCLGGSRGREGRLRIGYLSADFHQHADQPADGTDAGIARPRSLRGDAALGPAPTRTARCASGCATAASTSRSYVARASRRWPRASAELGIDILVDLKGATYDTLVAVLAQRPAPLAGFLARLPRGRPARRSSTTASATRWTTPLADARALQREDRPVAALLPAQRRASRIAAGVDARAMGVPDHALVLCAFHQSYKISADAFDTWCALLRRAAGRGALAAALECRRADEACRGGERGVGPERLVFLRQSCRCRRISAASPAQTSISTPGRTTRTRPRANRSGLGVPVLTLQGRTFAQRVAASVLHTVGLDELVCVDVAGYRKLALEAWFGDPARRSALRRASARTAHGEPALRRCGVRARHRGALRTDVGASRRREDAGAPAGVDRPLSSGSDP